MNKGLILSLALSLSALTASADLMHVTAQGTVSSSYKYNHNTGTQIDGIVQAGTTVQYSFIFDTDQNVTFTSPDGTVYQYNDYSQYGHSLDYFYADFQGSYVLPDNGNTTNTGGYDIGIDDLYLNGTYSAAWLMSDRNSNHYAWMYNSSNNDTTTIDTWAVGTTLHGFEQYNTNNTSDYIYSNLTITSISQDSPLNVPEPSMFALMVCSVLLIASFMVFRRTKVLSA